MVKNVVFIKNLFYKAFDFALISLNAVLLCASVWGFIYSLCTGDRCSGKLCNFTHDNIVIYIIYNFVMLTIVSWAFVYGLRKIHDNVWYSRFFISFPFLYPLFNLYKDLLIEYLSVPSYYL